MRNPKPCPLLEVLEAGNFLTSTLADSADIRHCIPKYRVFRDGELVEEVDSIEHLWQDDFVSFLLGCSFSFEEALEQAGFVPRHVEQGVNVPMFNTSIDCASAGVFADTHMVVSMRPYPPSAVAHVRAITEQFPRVHGSPVHVGDPSSIGIQDISRPDYGDAVELKEGEVPVFWACGVTPQLALKQARFRFVLVQVLLILSFVCVLGPASPSPTPPAACS